MVLLTHYVQSLSLNLTQVTHCHPAHIYVSLVGYLVPHHHLPIQLLHVHLRSCSRVFLCGKREEKVCAEMWVNILSMTTTDRPSFQFIKVLVPRLRWGLGTRLLSGFVLSWSYSYVVSSHFLITCSPYCDGKLGGAWEQDYWARWQLSYKRHTCVCS